MQKTSCGTAERSAGERIAAAAAEVLTSFSLLPVSRSAAVYNIIAIISYTAALVGDSIIC